MRGLSLLLFVCAGLGVSGISTRLGDRATLVSPPEARVEAFLRELRARRSRLAVNYLSDELRPNAPASHLQHAFDVLVASSGDVENVDAETLSWDWQSALARGKLVFVNGRRMAVDFRLKWERGGWAIDMLPASLVAAPGGRLQD